MVRRVPLVVSVVLYLVILGLGYQYGGWSLARLGVWAVVLFIGFLSPAQWLSSFFDIGLRWKPILSTSFAAAILWDVLTAYVLEDRKVLSDFLSVYLGGIVVFVLLLALHVLIVRAVKSLILKR